MARKRGMTDRETLVRVRALDGGGWAIAGVPLGPVPTRAGHKPDGRPSWLEIAARAAFASAPPLRPHVLRQGKQDSAAACGRRAEWAPPGRMGDDGKMGAGK